MSDFLHNELRKLTNHLSALQPAMVEALRELVEYQSPSTDKPLLDALAQRLQERYQRLGAEAITFANATHGDHVCAAFATDHDSPTTQPGLLLGHFDTVWPVGTLAARPFHIHDGKAWGPGVFDMKAGIVVAEFALRAIGDLGLRFPRPVVVLMTSDEEIGSPTSRPLIEEHARHAEYVLVLEPPLPDGALKTARKGVGHFILEIEGRAAHAGVEPEKGISAVEELAHQVLHLHSLSDPSQGTTVNVGVIRGGTRSNVVAAHAQLEVDARAWTTVEAERIEGTILRSSPLTPGATLRVEGGFNRPPMERSPAIAALFQRAQRIGCELGIELQEGRTGGGSDANFSAALGVPTLDGLGALGDGAHAEHEHIYIDSLPTRAALLAALLLRL